MVVRKSLYSNHGVKMHCQECGKEFRRLKQINDKEKEIEILMAEFLDLHMFKRRYMGYYCAPCGIFEIKVVIIKIDESFK